MPLTLTEASAAVGMTRAGVLKAIKRGAISATRDEGGMYHIEPAELHRIYPPISQLPAGNSQETHWQALAVERAETIVDLRRRLDAAEARLDRLLLTDQRPRRPWWRFGR